MKQCHALSSYLVDVLESRHLQSLAESCVGYVPADLQALVREGRLQVRRPPLDVRPLRRGCFDPQKEIYRCRYYMVLQAAREGRVLKMKDLMKALEVVGASALRGQGIQVSSTGDEVSSMRMRRCPCRDSLTHHMHVTYGYLVSGATCGLVRGRWAGGGEAPSPSMCGVAPEVHRHAQAVQSATSSGHPPVWPTGMLKDHSR